MEEWNSWPSLQVLVVVYDHICLAVHRDQQQGVATSARNRAEIEHAHHVENYDERADIIGMMTTYFGDPQIVNGWLEPYENATVDDITRIAAQYLVPENRATSLFVPSNLS